MGMSITDENGRRIIRQILVAPVVYLDHWAVRDFSSNAELRSRFVSAMKAKSGTLLISLDNLSEFTAVSDKQNAFDAEAFFDLMLPDIYIADFTMDKGFMFPEGLPAEGGPGPGQNWLLKTMGDLAENGYRLTTKGLITTGAGSAELYNIFQYYKIEIAKKMNEQKQDAEFIKRCRDFVLTSEMTLQRMVSAELSRDFYLNPTEVFKQNDSTDMMHAAGALMVADIILLDGKWCRRTQAAVRKIQTVKPKIKFAKTFSKSAGGLKDFFECLESLPEGH